MAGKPQKNPEPRIAAGAAMIVAQGGLGNVRDAGDLSQRMANAYTRAIEQGLSDEERSKAIDAAVLRFQAGEPEP